MNERDALDIVQAAIWTIIVASGPAVGAAMLVGTAIALIQALTQVQEVTLTFVPKIIAVLAVTVLMGLWMLQIFTAYTAGVFNSFATPLRRFFSRFSGLAFTSSVLLAVPRHTNFFAAGSYISKSTWPMTIVEVVDVLIPPPP